jgi:hypothetical protein
MPWVFVGKGEPLTGFGPGPLTDEEFEEKVKWHEAQFEGQKGAVVASGLYEQVTERTANRRMKSQAEAADEAVAEESN